MRFIYLVCLWCVSVAMPSLVWAAGPFVVKNVQAELLAFDPATSRDVALEQAADAGLKQLLKVLTPESTWPQHEQALSGVKAQSLLERFSLVRENNATPYQLVVDLYFSRNGVRRLLSQAGMPYTDTQGGAILLLPVFVQRDASTQLFEESNPWAKALQGVINQPSRLLQYALPRGDYDDMMAITPDMAVLGTADAIQAMADRYRVATVVVPQAKLVTRGAQKVVSVEAMWFGDKVMPANRFEVPVTKNGAEAAALAKAAQTLLTTIENAWRNTNAVAVDKSQSLVAFLQVNQPKALEALLANLNAIPAIEKAFLRSLTREEAYIQIDYFGETENMVKALQARQIRLQDDEGRWVLNSGRFVPQFSMREAADASSADPIEPAAPAEAQ